MTYPQHMPNLNFFAPLIQAQLRGFAALAELVVERNPHPGIKEALLTCGGAFEIDFEAITVKTVIPVITKVEYPLGARLLFIIILLAIFI